MMLGFVLTTGPVRSDTEPRATKTLTLDIRLLDIETPECSALVIFMTGSI